MTSEHELTNLITIARSSGEDEQELIAESENLKTDQNNENFETQSMDFKVEIEKDEEEEDDELDDLTNLAWLTELRNQGQKVWHNGIIGLDKIPATTLTKTTIRTNHLNSTQLNEHDTQYENTKRNNSLIEEINSSSLLPKCTTAVNNTVKQQQSNTECQKRPMKRPTPIERFDTFCKKVKRDFEEYEKKSLQYQTMDSEKPPFNYSHIIGMVMLEKGRVTLQQICAWIEIKFAYFRSRKKWNNSIRHNLSLHPCFRKIDRKKYEKGKGGYWELGIDLKKCERKRIRHRKNVQKQQRLLQEQHQQEPNIECLDEVVVEKEENAMPNLEENEEEIDDQESLNISLQLETGEFLLDDELDVQQHVDVTSCCTTSISNDNQQQQQQYQLGTIIISGTTTANNSMATTANTYNRSPDEWPQHYQTMTAPRATSTTASILNCFIAETDTSYNSNHLPSSCEVNDIECHPQQQGDHVEPNVIVEEIVQRPLLNNYQVSTLLSPLTINYNEDNINNNNNPSSSDNNVGNYIFQPEIDSIEEAFQYLRSLDSSNRDDTLLDHFFDVSVSDF